MAVEVVDFKKAKQSIKVHLPAFTPCTLVTISLQWIYSSSFTVEIKENILTL